MNDKLVQWVLKHLFILNIIVICSIVIASYGITFLGFQADDAIFFKKDNPQLVAHRTVQNTYTKDDNLLIIIAPEDKQVFQRNILSVIEQVTDEAWRFPYATRVDSITNFQHSYAEEDDLIVRDLIKNSTELSTDEIQQIQNIALNEPLLVKRIISSQGHVTAIMVTLTMPEPNELEIIEVVKAARILKDKIETDFPEIKIYLLGSVIFDAAFGELAKSDSSTLVPLMFIIVLLVLCIAFRSVIVILPVSLVIFGSIGFALGCFGWLGYNLNTISITAPIVIMTLAVADSVHLLSIYYKELSKGTTKKTAMTESLKVNFYPIFITSFTTAIGFLGLNSSEVPPMQEFGNLVAVGVTAAFLMSITLIPGLILWLPGTKANPGKPFHSAIVLLADKIITHRQALLWGMLCLIVITVCFIPNNELNEDTFEYFSKKVPVRQAADFAVENLTGSMTIAYSIDSKRQNGVSDPEFLSKVESFSHWLRQQPEVMYVSTYTDTIKRLNKNMHGDDPDQYKIPETNELSAQFLLLYEMSLPYGLDLNNQISFDKSSLKVTAVIRNEKTKGILSLNNRARQWFQQNAPALMTEGASIDVTWAHITQRNIVSMLVGSGISLLLITLTLIIVLRSVKYGLLSLLPNILPIAITFGLWGLFVGQISFTGAGIFSVTIGIVVDNTIYLLSKYLRAKRHYGYDPINAISYSITTVGPALIITSIILTSGFLILLLSNFSVNSTMGSMVAITIAAAIIFDFTALPGLLIKIDRHPVRTLQNSVN